MANSISISANLTQKLNFAFVQNYVPVIRSIVLTNTTGQTLDDLTLKISFEPESSICIP